MDFTPEDIANIKKLVLVGMPGVGKSTISNAIATLAAQQGYPIQVFSTDEYLSQICKNPNNPVVTQVLHNYSGIDLATIQTSSLFIAQYGDAAFRQMEADAILQALNAGLANDKMLNLGGKAILHPQTSEALTNRGYNIIYLRSHLLYLFKNVLIDFNRAQRGAIIHRSHIHDPVLQSMQNIDKEITIKVNTLGTRACFKELLTNGNLQCLSTAISVLKARDTKIMEILTSSQKDRDSKYKKASSLVIEMTPFLNINIHKVLQAIKHMRQKNS